MRQPFVAAIMPTRNRPWFVAQAIEYFQRQGYPGKVLVIVDNSDDDRTRDIVKSYHKQGVLIEYLRATREKQTIGALRNTAVIGAMEVRAEIVIHWDDDDWHHPDRIEKQVTALMQSKERGVVMNGFSSGLFWWPFKPDRVAYRYNHGNRSYTNGNPYIMGATMCYFTHAWEDNQFQDRDIAEDNFFLRGFPEGQVEALPYDSLYVVIRHNRNTDYNTTPEQAAYRKNIWEQSSYRDVFAIMGKDVQRYINVIGVDMNSKTSGTVLVKLSHDWSRHRQGEPTPRAGAIVDVTPEELARLRSDKRRHDVIVSDEAPAIGEALPNTRAVELHKEPAPNEDEEDGA